VTGVRGDRFGQAGVADQLTWLLGELVRCPSLGPGPATDRAVELLQDYLHGAGVDTRTERSAAGVPTLLATVHGSRPGPHLLLLGHVDVVPVDEAWIEDPFTARIDDAGLMHGRGTVDMKSGIAAFAVALRTLCSSGGLPAGSVTLLVDADEETGSEAGLLPYIAGHGLAEYDWAICGEPTGLRPYLGNRGLIWASMRISGRASHAGMPDQGMNPVPTLATLIHAFPRPRFASGPYGARGPSLTPTVVRAGQVVNSIPDVAELAIDRRLVPGEDVESTTAGLHDIAREVAARSGMDISVSIDKVWPPCLLDETSELARSAQRATARGGRDSAFGFDDACNDASFTHAAGVPTLIWGPGAPELAHTSHEHVALTDVHAAHDLYLEVITELCQQAEHR
jgi:acetylornithine deacetylase/succinyl-diaminopimelate desuccinylase-like protein